MQSKTPMVTFRDVTMMLSCICGLLLNIILYLVGFWICQTNMQLIIIMVGMSLFFGYVIDTTIKKIIRFVNWRF